MTDVLSHKRFHDEQAAYDWVEAHLWPEGPVCPKCGGKHDRVTKLQGKSTRIGVYKCKDCRKPFTVKVGTIFEDSHIPLRMWLQAIALLAASKKGISSNQLHRMLGITLKSAWFMSHRIREAMRSGGLAPPMGGSGSVVEVDETFFGNKKGMPIRRGLSHKHAVLTLVERGGEARSFHIEKANIANVVPIARANIDKETKIVTDTASYYGPFEVGFAGYDTVNHGIAEYVRGEIHTNTVESYFSVFKRGMKGTYQHCNEKHLHRYLAEFDFRYNARIALGVNDQQRADQLLNGAKGKRLTYRAAGSA
ncbi:IS1595 family transposase [Hyphomicrobium sp.]|uniref:IS1595 family transposase n=1 Tax=Hyphomicrobium sp. TaxID=82 RepID=UPI0035652456